nr:hypothetical protein [Tanacetum cinerariifolium]
MEAHLAPTQPTQVKKITISYEISNVPHDTRYYMEDPEQAFVEYASSRTDEAGGKTKSYPVRIVKDVEVHIGKLKLLNDFYVIDMKKDPETPLLVGRGFLATANVVIDCRMAKIAVGEGITRSYGNRNVVTSPAKGNGNGINGNLIRCYNYRGLGHYANNYTVKPRKRDVAYLQQQLQITQKEEAGIQSTQEEFEFMAFADAYEETKRVKTSTSGTQSDKALVYDSDGSTKSEKFRKQFLKEEAKFVRDFKSLAKEADESLAKQKALELEIECLLRAVDEKDPKEDPADYPPNRGNNDDDESSNDDDDDDDVEKDEEDREEEEHVAPADPSDVSTDDLVLLWNIRDNVKLKCREDNIIDEEDKEEEEHPALTDLSDVSKGDLVPSS